MEEEHHPDIINYTDNSGKEVISAYWFDGSKKLFDLSVSPIPSSGTHASNRTSDGLLQSIGHYWEWVSLYCCSSQEMRQKSDGLSSFFW